VVYLARTLPHRCRSGGGNGGSGGNRGGGGGGSGGGGNPRVSIEPKTL